jgi:hypothetical protein
LIEVFAAVVGEKPENQVAVLLKQSILATVAPVGVWVADTRSDVGATRGLRLEVESAKEKVARIKEWSG